MTTFDKPIWGTLAEVWPQGRADLTSQNVPFTTTPTDELAELNQQMDAASNDLKTLAVRVALNSPMPEQADVMRRLAEGEKLTIYRPHPATMTDCAYCSPSDQAVSLATADRLVASGAVQEVERDANVKGDANVKRYVAAASDPRPLVQMQTTTPPAATDAADAVSAARTEFEEQRLTQLAIEARF